MKDAVKCRIIDAMMLGHDVEIVYNSVWACWSLVDEKTNKQLFNWRHEHVPLTMDILTLKDAMGIIEQRWDDRILTTANEYSEQWTSA